MSLISVIVPVYKVESYLRECVDSILNQTFKDFELILVDDGSPDNCPKICDEYKEKDNRVIVIHKENGGLSSARNAGLDIAKGKYISFIDGDDYIDKNFLKNLFDEMDSNDICMCYYSVFGDAKCMIDDKMINAIIDSSDYWDIPHSSDILSVAWNKLYSSYIFKDIRYPVGKIHEDEFVIHHIIGKCKKIRIISKRLYFYRQRDDSIMGLESKNGIDLITNLELFTDRASFFYNKNEKLDKNYAKAFRILLKIYNRKNKRIVNCFKTLKELYFKNKKRTYAKTLGEVLFYLFPRVFCLIKKTKK